MQIFYRVTTIVSICDLVNKSQSCYKYYEVRELTRPADLPKEYLIDIGQRIRGQRKRLNLTQQQAAELLGVSPNFYGKVERGIHGFSYPSLIKLPQVLHVSLDYIFTGKVHADSQNPILDITNDAPDEKRIYLENMLRWASYLYREEPDK